MNEEFPGAEVSIGRLCLQGHHDPAIPATPPLLLWPVRVAGLLPLLVQVAQHHHHLALELPHHPPEVSHRVLQGTLRGYVGIAPLVALQGEGGGGRKAERGRRSSGGVACDIFCTISLTSMKLALM